MAAKHLASPSVSLITFWGTPFLEKGAPKITEGGPFDPHWPISRINPATNSKAQVKEKLVHVGQI